MALIIGADSFVPHAELIGLYFSRNGWTVELVILTHEFTDLINERQLKRLSVNPDSFTGINIRRITREELMHRDFYNDYSSIFLGIPGTQTQVITSKINQIYKTTPHERPITIGCFPGVLYYIQTYGQWTRCGTDILLFNERRTMNDYTFARRHLFGNIKNNAILFGYPALYGTERNKIDNGPIVYIDQLILPRSYRSRKILVRKLFDLSEYYKNKDVIILARSKLQEVSNHSAVTLNHISTIVEEVKHERPDSRPPMIEYGSPHALIASASLCLGITSTLLLAAMQMGVPTAPLRTPGIRGPFNGFRLFQKSPMAMTFDELLAGNSPPPPDPTWMENNVHTPNPVSINLLIEKAEGLLVDIKNSREPRGKIKPAPNFVMKIICKMYDIYVHSKL